MAIPKFDNIMIDMETLGTTADCVILSIGAVKFTLEGAMDDNAFYASVALDSQPGRHMSESALLFWMKQDPEAQKVFFEPKTPLENAVREFASWVDHGNYKVWSNGADFDIPIINHCFKEQGIESPWKFWNQRCFRTLKSFGIGATVAKPPGDVAHNALDDCIAQITHLHAIVAASRPDAPRMEKSFVKQTSK